MSAIIKAHQCCFKNCVQIYSSFCTFISRKILENILAGIEIILHFLLT